MFGSAMKLELERHYNSSCVVSISNVDSCVSICSISLSSKRRVWAVGDLAHA